MKRVIGVLALLCPFLLRAQEAVKPLTVGDVVPDLSITNISNYQSSAARLSDFRGRLLILDFWEAYCGACIRALPRLDTLQKKYAGQLQILTVTRWSTAAGLQKDLERFRPTRGLKLPTIIGDSVLCRLFPHELLSHVVWIGPDGRVKAITGTEYVTRENIETVLAGRPVHWPVKRDAVDFDYAAPLAGATGPLFTAPVYGSVFAGYGEGLDQRSHIGVDSSRGLRVINHFNNTLLQLARQSVENANGDINPKLLRLEVKDSSRYLFDRSKAFYGDWQRTHTWCYSLTLPLELSKAEAARHEREDLARWLYGLFGVRMIKEPRMVPCWVMVRTGSQDRLATRGGPTENTLAEPGPIKRLKNATLVSLTAYLNKSVAGLPWVVDETGYPRGKRVDMELRVDRWHDLAALRRELQRYGLDLVEGERELGVYVVREAVIY